MVLGSIKRLSKVARDFNVGISTIVDFLHKKGFDIGSDPNSKISEEAFTLLEKEYKGDINLKKESEKINLKSHRGTHETISLDDVKEAPHKHHDDEYEDDEVIIKGHSSKKTEPVPSKPERKDDFISATRQEIEAPKVLGKIDLNNLGGFKKKEEPVASSEKPVAAVKKPMPEERPIQEPPVEAPEEKPVKPVQPERPAKIESVEADNGNDESSDSEMLSMDVPKVEEVKVVGRIDLDMLNQKTRPAKKTKKQREDERRERERSRRDVQRPAESEPAQNSSQPEERTAPVVIKARVEKLSGPTVVGKIDLPEERKPQGGGSDQAQQQNRKRKENVSRKKVPKISNA
jgi:translation initiation factor IF-2